MCAGEWAALDMSFNTSTEVYGVSGEKDGEGMQWEMRQKGWSRAGC